MLERMSQDFRLARRALTRSPGFTAVTVCTLALGIGATTALFTVVNSVLLRPLRFPDPDQLVMVWEQPAPGRTNVVQTQNFLDWRDRNKSFEAIAAIHPLPMNLSRDGNAEQVPGLRVTGEFFSIMGVQPLLGRGIVPGEDVIGGPRTAVLSYGLWQLRFGSDPNVIGRRISIGGATHEIVGVMPRQFSFPGFRAALFIPLQIDRATAPREGRNFSTVARLRRNVDLRTAQAEMEAIASQTARERPEMNAKWSATVVRLIDQAVGQVRLALLSLLGAVVCVLLIACANTTNLQLMRATARMREMSVRLALGATRARLVQQLAVESVLLATIGGVMGLLLARVGVPLVVAMFPSTFPLPRADEISVDGRALAFTMAVSVGAGLIFGMAPALQAGRGRVGEALRSAGRAVTSGGARLRASLVVVEVMLACLLVVDAGLMARSLANLYDVDPGFKPERVLTMRMLLMPSRYRDVVRRAAFVNQVLERVAAVQGVTAAASIHLLPLTGMNSGTAVYRSDRPTPPPGDQPGSDVSVVSPDYFRAMGIPLTAGRTFDVRDRIDTPRVTIINRALAQRFYGTEDPVGKRLRIWWGSTTLTGDIPEFQIVGVVANSRQGALRFQPDPCVYLAQSQEPSLYASLVVRTTGDPLAITSAVRHEIRNVDPDQGVSDVEPMETVVADSIARQRLQAILLSAFSGLALVMASVGLYGVISYSFEQRRREMGIRAALGATPGSLLRLILGDGLRMTGVGLAAGLAASLMTTRYLASLLFEVKPADPAVFAAVSATLLVTALIASGVPGRAAMRVDPARVLHDE